MDDPVRKRFGVKPDARKPAKRPAPRPAVKYMAEHSVAAGETLSDLSLKYYGSAVKSKYMLIYEANKATIGDDPNLIKVGMVLNIPELPSD